MREIENALLANHKRLYHLGMEAVAKSTLSEAMNRRNPEIFQALFEEILDRVIVVIFRILFYSKFCVFKLKIRSEKAGEDKKVTKGSWSCFFYEVFVPAQQRQK